ncbi:hypothetical protein C8J57DRAFT_1473004 [Mycena rebaudengoi]|nr:hypothetical protein C8J57DRAFT_1473004 [Mycena rebaudengoi]
MVHYLSNQPPDERLSTHRGLSVRNIRRGGLQHGHEINEARTVCHRRDRAVVNRSPVGPVPPEFLALLDAYERILDDIRRHIENAQISTNKRGNLFSRHMSSSRLKNELKNQLKTMLRGGQPAPPTSRENTVEILSVSLRASAAICEAPPLNFLKPIVGLAALICETAKTAKSNRDAAEELAKRAISVTNCVVERASKTEIFLDTNEDALNGPWKTSIPMFLEKRRRAMSWMLATQEKDRVAQLNAGLDRALSLFMTTCVLSSNECLRSSNELVRSNTIQLDVLASTVKQLDGEMSQNFAVGWLGEDGLGCPPDGVALAEAYKRLESESDGADGKEALERFVEARTALVAEAERVRRHPCPSATWTTDARVTKRLIAASHAPADVTEGSYSIMDSPYLPPHLEAWGVLHSYRTHSSTPALPPLSPPPYPPRPPFPLPSPSLTPTPQATTQPSRTSSPFCTLRTPPAWCVGMLAAGVYAAGVALVDDELAREKAEELAGGGADAEVDVGEAGGARAARPGARSGEHERAGELEDADPARGAGTDDVLRLDPATSVFTRLGSWVPGRRIGWARAHLRCGLLQSFWEGESAALRVRGCGAREARAAEMDGVDAQRGGRKGEDGADVTGGRAACGGGGKGRGGGARGGRECAADVRQWQRAEAVHENRAWARSKGGGAGGVGGAFFLVIPFCAHTHKMISRARCFMSFPGAAVRGPVAEYRHGRARRTGRGWGGSRVEPVSRRSAVEPTSTPTPLNPLPE